MAPSIYRYVEKQIYAVLTNLDTVNQNTPTHVATLNLKDTSGYILTNTH